MNNIPSNELIGWKMWEHGVPDSRLTIIDIDEPRICKNGRKRTKLKCLCNCGNITSVDRSNLLRGGVKSCGCYKKDYIKATKSTHGEAHSRLYNVWSSIKNRCYNKNEPEYKNYGGRGIVMCDEWLNDYLSFKKWAEETGYDKDAPKGQCTIDRIDVNGNYEPSNCRWITMEEQLKNTSNPKMKNSNVWNHGYRVVAYDDGYHLVREDNDVINAIALAYRSGFLRAKKGRPFKIGGEKN